MVVLLAPLKQPVCDVMLFVEQRKIQRLQAAYMKSMRMTAPRSNTLSTGANLGTNESTLRIEKARRERTAEQAAEFGAKKRWWHWLQQTGECEISAQKRTNGRPGSVDHVDLEVVALGPGLRSAAAGKAVLDVTDSATRIRYMNAVLNTTHAVRYWRTWCLSRGLECRKSILRKCNWGRTGVASDV